MREVVFKFYQCVRGGLAGQAKQIFDCLTQRDVRIWNALLHASSRCDPCLWETSLGIFERMPQRDTVSWNRAMSACCRSGLMDAAISMFYQMPQRSELSWNAVIHSGDLDRVKHAFDLMPHWTTASWNSILAVMSDCDSYLLHDVFNSMLERDVISWNTIITANARLGHLRLAYVEFVFTRMPYWTLNASTAMIKLYGESGLLEQAGLIFHQVPDKDTLCWSTILHAYSVNGYIDMVECVFCAMPSKDVVAWACLVSSYARIQDIETGCRVYHKMPACSTSATNSILSAFAAAGCSLQAEVLFKAMPYKSPASWGAMIEAYFQEKNFHQARHLVSLLPMKNLCLETVVISGHAKQGHFHDSKLVFDSIPEKNVLSWNAVIAAFAQNGEVLQALEFLQEMLLEGVCPTYTTFTPLLHGCSHSGRILQALDVFCLMVQDYGITPLVDHYNCIVDLLGRLKRLDEAEELTHSMPVSPSSVTWTSLLSASRLHGDVPRGGRLAQTLALLNPPAAYSLLSNALSCNNCT